MSATESALQVTEAQIDAFELELANVDGQIAGLQHERDLIVSQLESAKELRRTLKGSLAP